MSQIKGYKKGGVLIDDIKKECIERIKSKGYCDLHYHVINQEDRPCAYLLHSCDEWIIGGVKEIKQMIADLRETLNYMEVVEALKEELK